MDNPDSKYCFFAATDLPSQLYPDWGERGSAPEISELVEFAKSLDNSI